MTKEELSRYTHLTIKKASTKCGLSVYKLKNLAVKYNLTFSSKKPSKEELSNLTHLSVTEIAKMYEVTRPTVSKWTSEYGIKLTRKKYETRASLKPSKEELLSLLNLTPKEVSEKYGVSKQCVSLWCKEYGIQFRNGRGVSLIKPKPSKEDLLGKTLKEIATEFGVSESLANKWKIQYGIKTVLLRPSKERLEELKHLPQVEIARILGIVQTYVSILYKQYKIERTPFKKVF